MGILSRLFNREKIAVETDRFRRVSDEPAVSVEQTQMNRDAMESQMAASRASREAASEHFVTEDTENQGE